MEQKDINKILVGAVVASCIVSVVTAVFSFAAYRKLSAANDLRSNVTSEAVLNVDLGPVAFAGFAGRPVSATLESKGDQKIFELRGHVMQDPKTPYEAVSEKDTTMKKVIIDRNTKLYRIVKGGEYPKVSGLEFDQFSVGSTEDTYVAYYEAGAGESITDSTPAQSLSIHVK